MPSCVDGECHLGDSGSIAMGELVMKSYNLTSVMLGLAASVALGGCSAKPAQVDIALVEEEVREGALGVVAAYNAQDVDRAASFDAPDYVGIFHGTPNTVGPEADAEGMRIQIEAADVNWALGEDSVTVAKFGDLGVFEAPYTFTVTDRQSGATMSESGNWVAIFRRQNDGTMKLWRSIGSDTPSPPEAAGEPLSDDR